MREDVTRKLCTGGVWSRRKRNRKCLQNKFLEENCNIGQYLVQSICIYIYVYCIDSYIFRYLCYCGGIMCVFFSSFFYSCYLAKGTGRQAFGFSICVEFLKAGTWERVCVLYYKLSKRNEYEHRKLIIKSQIYNDSNCNNNKHSRWAQCNFFPLLHFYSLSFLLHSHLHTCTLAMRPFFLSYFCSVALGFQFPSISCFRFLFLVYFDFYNFHMTINFLVVSHHSSLSPIAKFQMIKYLLAPIFICIKRTEWINDWNTEPNGSNEQKNSNCKKRKEWDKMEE